MQKYHRQHQKTNALFHHQPSHESRRKNGYKTAGRDGSTGAQAFERKN